MPLPPEVVEAFADVDAATTEAGVYIEALRAKITTSMTPEAVAEVKAGLAATATRLRGIAVDPVEPVPDPPIEFTNAVRRG